MKAEKLYTHTTTSFSRMEMKLFNTCKTFNLRQQHPSCSILVTRLINMSDKACDKTLPDLGVFNR